MCFWLHLRFFPSQIPVGISGSEFCILVPRDQSFHFYLLHRFAFTTTYLPPVFLLPPLYFQFTWQGAERERCHTCQTARGSMLALLCLWGVDTVHSCDGGLMLSTTDLAVLNTSATYKSIANIRNPGLTVTLIFWPIAYLPFNM